MTCEECERLATHAFRGVDDLVHAVRLAAEEADRGVLKRMDDARSSAAEREAVDSSLASGALPNTLRYRFRCEVCGDGFTLHADTRTGEGGWTRDAEA